MFLFKNIKNLILPFFMLFTFFLQACGSESENPLVSIKRELKDTPTFTVILDDMKEEGFFSKKYQHKYRIVTPDESRDTRWHDVSSNYYSKYEPYLGMAILSKKDGVMDESVAPAGYSYVGDSRYGRWHDNGSGGSFWEFYGKYRMFSDFMGAWYRPVGRSDYQTYTDYSSRRQPYFGRNNEFGTNGNTAKTAKPDFFERRMSRQKMSSTTFGDRVNSRVGRTRTSFRGRSGGFGK